MEAMTIRISLGVVPGDDPLRAIHAAAAAARHSGEEIPKAALVVAAGASSTGALGAAARQSLGPVPISGASVAGILTDAGILTSGAAVMCFYGDALEPSAACAAHTTGLAAATERVSRLILAGACERRHYPRGVALAFARPVAESFAEEFLTRWRRVAGPKLRVVLSATPGAALYGPGSQDPGDLAVLCLEGVYQSGVGVACGFAPGETIPDGQTLVHGAADAAATAVKRLDGHSLRAALIAESAARYAALGPLARDEWLAMREQIGAEVPCLGWLTSAELGCGGGVTPPSETGSVVVAAIGDSPVAVPPAS
jgi:FIST C domain